MASDVDSVDRPTQHESPREGRYEKKTKVRISPTVLLLMFAITISANSVMGQVERLSGQTSVRFSDPEKADELLQLQNRIRDAGITKLHIGNLDSGTMRKALGIPSDIKKLLAWNRAGRRLFSSIEAAQKEGFVVWDFNPDSEAARFLDARLKEQGVESGYSDDLLYVLWDGLFDDLEVVDPP